MTIKGTIENAKRALDAWKDQEEQEDHEVVTSLSGLQEELGTELAEMTLSLFSDDSLRHFRELDLAVKSQDFVAINELAGSFALVSESISANDLKTACMELTDAAFSNDLKKSSDTISKMSSVYEEVMDIAETLFIPEHV